MPVLQPEAKENGEGCLISTLKRVTPGWQSTRSRNVTRFPAYSDFSTTNLELSTTTFFALKP